MPTPPMESAAVRTLPPCEIVTPTQAKEEKYDPFHDYRLGDQAPPAPGDAAKPAAKADALPGVDVQQLPSPCKEMANENASIVKDSAGRITSYKDAAGYNTSMSYDSNGRLTRSMETDPKGNLRSLDTTNYNDEAGVRTTSSVNFTEDGGISSTSEKQQQFKNGKLDLERTRNEYEETEVKFDACGRETDMARRDPRTGDLTEQAHREFLPDGGFKLTSSKFTDGHKSGETQAVYDKNDQKIGTEVSRDFDSNGKETTRVEISENADGSLSAQFFENGELRSDISRLRWSKHRDKTGDTLTEKHFDKQGKQTESIDAKYFPMQPYLPTKITVNDADGKPAKTVEINYVTRNGRIDPAAGSVARIADFSVTTPEGTQTHKFDNRAEQVSAWKQLFKATDSINSFHVPIGRPPKVQNIGAQPEYPYRGRTAEEALHDLPSSSSPA